MSFSLNPLDLFKVWKEEKRHDRESFIRWLSKIQEQLQALQEVWTEIRVCLEQSEEPDMAKLRGLMRPFVRRQSLVAVELSQFYRYASIAAEGRLLETPKSDLIFKLSQLISFRGELRNQLEAFLKKIDRDKYFYLEESNRVTNLDDIFSAIDKLQRELIALNVFIETIKSNPVAYR